MLSLRFLKWLQLTAEALRGDDVLVEAGNVNVLTEATTEKWKLKLKLKLRRRRRVLAANNHHLMLARTTIRGNKDDPFVNSD
jgi:hypothetical protein